MPNDMFLTPEYSHSMFPYGSIYVVNMSKKSVIQVQ